MYRPTHITGFFGALILMLCIQVSHASSATWKRNARSGDWNTKTNWTPAHVPNASTDTATFALSNTTNVSISANTAVNGITFTPAATNPYTITASPGFTLTVSGSGITNNSGITQNFVTDGQQFGQISFTNNATAGSSTIFTNNHGLGGFEGGHTFFFNTSTAGNGTFINQSGAITGLFQGFMEFFDNSTTGNGTFTNNGSTISNIVDGGEIHFFDTSTAGSGTFINNGATASNAGGGIVVFFNNSTAGNGTFINNGGTVAGGGVTQFGVRFVSGISSAGNGTFVNNGGMISGAQGGSTHFFTSSTADSATLIANGGKGGGQGGTIFFEDNSTGGTSRVEIFDNGNLDISFHDTPGVTVGSIEGNGNVFLGANNLTVGSNNLSTAFSGVIQDGGSLTKIGTGTLHLTGSNTYTGNTKVDGGVLQVDGSITSNTFVHELGTLAGTGTVHGNVTENIGGTVRPGDASGNAPGKITVDSYTSTIFGRLVIDILGLSSGQFSVLDVLGVANVNNNGLLDPVLQNGFIPAVGDQITFMYYSDLTGPFGIADPTFDNGMEHWSVTYQPTAAILTVEAGPGRPNVPDPGSTFLLLTLSLLGLVTYRQKCVARASRLASASVGSS